VSADLLFTNGVVHTVDASRSVAGAVAVQGGRITAVGSASQLASLGGPGTRVVDLQGGMLLPGFQDAHAHPCGGGMEMLQCALFDVAGAEAQAVVIAEYATEHPDREWIEGGGWSSAEYPHGCPTREALDAVTDGRPALLLNRDAHTGWANSRAFELAGITADTPDPDGGRIERQADGSPAGALHEAAIGLIQEHLPRPTQAQRVAGIRYALAEYHRLGITAWQDANAYPGTVEAYAELARSGELTARVHANLGWDAERGEEQLAELIELRERGRIGRLTCDAVKFFHDGVVEVGTACMLEPYLDDEGRPTENTGLDQYERAALAAYVAACDAAGFQVHIHAIGDRAVRECLDHLEAAVRANGVRDARHHLAHVQFVHADDLPRFRQLGVIANMTPLWARAEEYVTELTIPFISARAAATMYPIGSLLRSGAQVAFGSDWTVSTQDPLQQLATAVKRRDPHGEAEEPLLPEERIGLGDAIAAHTITAAHVGFLDDSTGSIEAGKLADLVVLDRDLFGLESPVEAKVLMTLVEGEVVYADPGFEGAA